jgi:hypothetical protein
MHDGPRPDQLQLQLADSSMAPKKAIKKARSHTHTQTLTQIIPVYLFKTFTKTAWQMGRVVSSENKAINQHVEFSTIVFSFSCSSTLTWRRALRIKYPGQGPASWMRAKPIGIKSGVNEEPQRPPLFAPRSHLSRISLSSISNFSSTDLSK